MRGQVVLYSLVLSAAFVLSPVFASVAGKNHGDAQCRRPMPAVQASAPAGTRLSVVQEPDAYNSWSMIQKVDGILVCVYSRGSGHTIEGARGAYARTSSDGGLTWLPETCITNDPVICEGAEGVGLDHDGAMLMWMNWRGRGRIRHELFRTRDGVRFTKISEPELSPEPTQVTGIIRVPGVGLMAMWFSGNYRSAGGGHAWGTLISGDNGRTWTQRAVEADLPRNEWPTEISVVSLGGGRLLAIGRSERETRRQFQLTSLDGGRTWKKTRTNIRNVNESTPSLVYDAGRDLVSNYYYERGPGILWRRTARAADVFDRPEAWPEPVEVARGGRFRPYDSGNVNAVADGDVHHLTYYTGDPTNTAVVVATVPAVPAPAK